MDFNTVTGKLNLKIIDYSKKLSGIDAPFYSPLISKLQNRLNILMLKGHDLATQDDLREAMDVYRECNQRRNIKFYTDNKYSIIAFAVLVGAVGANIFNSLKRQK